MILFFCCDSPQCVMMICQRGHRPVHPHTADCFHDQQCAASCQHGGQKVHVTNVKIRQMAVSAASNLTDIKNNVMLYWSLLM